MPKPDHSLRNICLAAVKRSSNIMHRLGATQLYEWEKVENLYPPLCDLPFQAGELPVASSQADINNWTLVSTRHIWACHEGKSVRVALDDLNYDSVGSHHLLHRMQKEPVSIHIRIRKAALAPFPTESGLASILIGAAIRTLIQIRN